jgi:hypothetical protein
MPGARNKLLLNSGGLKAGDCAVRGNAEATQEQFATALIVAEEIEKAGHLGDPQAMIFLHKIEAICKRSDKVQDAYIRSQLRDRLELRTVTDEMRLWIDSILFPSHL